MTSRIVRVLTITAAALSLPFGTWLLLRALHAPRPATADMHPPTPLLVAYRTMGKAPLQVRLDASGSTDNVGITAFHWDFDDGLTAEGPIVDHLFATAGVYQVRLTVVDAAGLVRKATQMIVADEPFRDLQSPRAKMSASVTRGPVPLTVAFDASSSTDNRSITRYRWRFDDDAFAEGASATHVFEEPGTYDVRLTVSDASGNSDDVEQRIVVEPGPPSEKPVAIFHLNPERLTAPGTVEFDARGSHDDRGIVSYHWDFGDETTERGAVVSHRYTHAGNFLVRLTVSDDRGQKSHSTRRLVVDEPTVLTERVLFDDRWAPGTGNVSPGATVVVGPDARSGRTSIHVTPTQPSAALQTRFNPVKLDAYDRLGFWINTERPSAIVLRALIINDDVEKFGPAIPVRAHLLPGAGGATTGVWQRAAIPLSTLEADRSKIAGFSWQGAEGQTLPPFALDDIALLPPDIELPPLSECAAPPPIRSFVERGASGLVADGVPFRAVGANMYYAQQLLSRHVQTQELRPLSLVRQALTAANCSGISVVRILGFNDNPPELNDDSVIQTAPGIYREDGLRGLDLALAEARKHHTRVILTLTNNWSAFGGIPRYASWAGIDPRRAMSDPQVLDWIVEYSRFLSQRVNTFTGVRYRDDPTILAVELANELRCPGCPEGRDATAFTAALARGVAPEWPNHLIGDGAEGFDTEKNLYAGLEHSYLLNANEGSSFAAIAAIPEIDLVSYHLYPDSWHLTDAQTTLSIDTHESIARTAGKLAYLGEFGLRTGDAERGTTYDQWLQRLFVTNGGALGLVWQIVYPGRPDNDGFALTPGQSLHAIGALARHSHQLMAPGLDGVSVAMSRR
jgi:PKD repeat protein